MKKWMLVLLLFLLPLNLSASPLIHEYICVSESSVGFNFNHKTGKWVSVDFGQGSTIYVVLKPKNKDAKHIAEIKRKGWFETESFCYEDREGMLDHLFETKIRNSNRLTCDGKYSVKVNLNKNILKFAVSDFGGYVYDPHDGHATAIMRIGSCTQL